MTNDTAPLMLGIFECQFSGHELRVPDGPSEGEDMILTFAKPKKVRSTEEHNETYVADSAPPGVYVPNMNKADKVRWKAKVVGSRSKNHQVEIRKTLKRGVQMLVVVNGTMPNVDKPSFEADPHMVKVSGNGSMCLSGPDWLDLQRAVREARTLLIMLDRSEPELRKTALLQVRQGIHPLESAELA